MGLSEVVQNAARQLDQAAARLEAGMAKAGGAAGRVGTAAAQAPASVAAAQADLNARMAALMGAPPSAGVPGATTGGAGRIITPPGQQTPAQEAWSLRMHAAEAERARGMAKAAEARAAEEAARRAALPPRTSRPVGPSVVYQTPSFPRYAAPSTLTPAGGLAIPPPTPVVPQESPAAPQVGFLRASAGLAGWAAKGVGGLALTAASATLTGLGVAAATATAGLYGVARLAGAANPSALDTFHGSLELLSITIGRQLVPVLDLASDTLQLWASIQPPAWLSVGIAAVTTAARQTFGIPEGLRAIHTPWAGGIVSTEAFDEGLQAAGISRDELQTEIMQKQLEVFQDYVKVSLAIANDVAAMRGAGNPSFR